MTIKVNEQMQKRTQSQTVGWWFYSYKIYSQIFLHNFYWIWLFKM